LCAASTLDKELVAKAVKGGSVSGAREVGLLVARRALEKGLNAVVFDRGGFLYHGRVKALADAAREGGLKF
jgi:large subunit ribosomal protein L18